MTHYRGHDAPQGFAAHTYGLYEVGCRIATALQKCQSIRISTRHTRAYLYVVHVEALFYRKMRQIVGHAQQEPVAVGFDVEIGRYMSGSDFSFAVGSFKSGSRFRIQGAYQVYRRFKSAFAKRCGRSKLSSFPQEIEIMGYYLRGVSNILLPDPDGEAASNSSRADPTLRRPLDQASEGVERNSIRPSSPPRGSEPPESSRTEVARCQIAVAIKTSGRKTGRFSSLPSMPLWLATRPDRP